MTWGSLLIGWVVFDVLVYVWMWLDDVYYTHNLPQKFKQMKNILTEE